MEWKCFIKVVILSTLFNVYKKFICLDMTKFKQNYLIKNNFINLLKITIQS